MPVAAVQKFLLGRNMIEIATAAAANKITSVLAVDVMRFPGNVSGTTTSANASP